MNNKTRKWIRAGAEAFITGATGGFSAPVGATILDPKDWGVSWHSAELAGMTFLAGGAVRFIHWWNTNPLPPEDDSSPPIPGTPGPPMISVNPLAKSMPVATFDPPKPDVAAPAQKP